MAEDQPRRPLFIVNGRRRKHWERHHGAVAAEIGDTQYTDCAGHAVDLARRAAAEGRPLVAAVGGDGTLNEVANGLMQHALAAGLPTPTPTALALIPDGTGSDFRRSLGLPSSAGAALELLRRALAAGAAAAAAGAAPVDVCRLACEGGGGGRVERFFVNIASCGVSADAAALIARRRWLGPTLGYTLASGEALLRMRQPPAELRIDGGEWVRLRATTAVAVGNGRCFGGGMAICPGADPRSGTLHVTALDGLGVFDFVRHQGALRRGELHRPKHGVTQFASAHRVELRPAEEGGRSAGGHCLAVECDGEVVGWAPMEVEVLPGALRFVC